jgi:hypothetical protein
MEKINMERLTRTINTVKEDVDIQVALDKLAAYENAEEQGRLIMLPTEAYYIDRADRIRRADVLSVTCKHLLVEEGPDFEINYTIDPTGESVFTGKLGVDVFSTENEAREKAYGF